jgi:hypothetical protein
MTLGYAGVTKTKVQRAIANFDSIKDLVDEMAPSYPVIFDDLRIMVSVAEHPMMTLNAEALNAIYWVFEYAYLGKTPREPDFFDKEDVRILVENLQKHD